MSKNVRAFEQNWVPRENYRPSTRRKTARDVRAAHREFEVTGSVPRSTLDALRRYALYLQTVPHNQHDGFDRHVLGIVEPSRAMPLRTAARKMVAQRFTETDWARLLAALEADRDAPEAAVILVMCRTGHRVGDVLRLPWRELVASRRTGVVRMERKGGAIVEVPRQGASDAWLGLERVGGAAMREAQQKWVLPDDATVALLVCPEGGGSAEAGECAYKRVERYLKKLGRELGLSGRVHLHRIRRTVALQALELTKDVHAVKELLGHRSLASTLKYVDEGRRAAVERLQRDLRSAS